MKFIKHPKLTALTTRRWIHFGLFAAVLCFTISFAFKFSVHYPAIDTYQLLSRFSLRSLSVSGACKKMFYSEKCIGKDGGFVPNGACQQPVIRSTNSSADSAYVSICLAIKDAPWDIREWVAYHQSIGVGRMYVYDDGSTPPLRSLLIDFINEGVVEYTYLAGPLKTGLYQQMAIYNDCLHRHAAQHTWIGAWDSDEFLIVRNESRALEDVLKPYEQYGGLGVTWRIFGSSGLQTRPPRGMLASYTSCTPASYPPNSGVKSLVNARYAVAVLGPHHFQYKPGFYAVNTDGDRVPETNSLVHLEDVLVLNHYFSRSKEDFQRKIERGSAMGRRKNWTWWETVNSLAVEECTYAVHLGERIQHKLQLHAGWCAGDD